MMNKAHNNWRGYFGHLPHDCNGNMVLFLLGMLETALHVVCFHAIGLRNLDKATGLFPSDLKIIRNSTVSTKKY